MEKPESIRRFDLLYLASIVTWLLASALSWNQRQAMIGRMPQLAGYEWLVPAGFAGVLAISILIWLLVRQRSVIGRVLAAISGGLSLLAVLPALVGLVTGQSGHWLATALAILSSLTNVIAAASLFAPSAHAWFGGEPETV
jgi:hypothetical protein